MKDLQTEEQRRRAIAWAIALTADTSLAPEQYERELLEQYAQGKLTLDEVSKILDTRCHHLLYRSQAVAPLDEAQLTALMEQARTYNEAHHITGLLCYSSSGHFVQLLEGPAEQVHALFAKIQQDPRHKCVQALSDYETKTRWFADWRMALVSTDAQDYYWLLGYLEARGHNLVEPQIAITSPHLLTLLQQFSKV
ncbi:MAG: BLUF domain-containing protein [Janthinobacterium lividum]